ncbi:protein-tyrosine-phosphatase [Kribbella sp. VKM Ac-2527]|uniref:Protein-tyrosine-phosphatase n=1 Tax=Kribbella caucasensis TaxID=2512215 RepID=A0A4V6PSR7_9ACTN|nr:protein-tyrosine-phosphatase [Kribbella sp. VKM Ac-2527]
MRLLAEPLRWRLIGELAGFDRRVGELVVALGAPQNLVSYHLRQLRTGGLVTARRSSFDARETYYHLDLTRCADALAATGAALHPALALRPDPTVTAEADRPVRRRVRVLFLCTGNSARSPIAAALLRHHGRAWVDAASAGSHPKPLHPGAVRVLREEYGIDLADHRPTHLHTLTGQRFDHVISLCDKVREICPEFPGHPEPVHWSIHDPTDITGGANAGDAALRGVARELDTRIRYLLPVLATSHQPEEEKES